MTVVDHGINRCAHTMCSDNYLYYTYSNTCFIIMLFRLHVVYSCVYFAGHMKGGRWASLLLATLVAASINTAMSGMQCVCELCLKECNYGSFTSKSPKWVSWTQKIHNSIYGKCSMWQVVTKKTKETKLVVTVPDNANVLNTSYAYFDCHDFGMHVCRWYWQAHLHREMGGITVTNEDHPKLLIKTKPHKAVGPDGVDQMY